MIKRIILILIIALSVFTIPVFTVSAGGLGDAFATDNGNDKDPLDNAARHAGFETRNANQRAEMIFGTIINALLSMLGIVFIGLAVYGGGLWMTAQGDQGKLEKAQKTLTAAVIGIIIVLGSYAISYYVLRNFITT